jgi:YHS domain-containing protein
MKKMFMLILGLVLAMCLVGAGFVAAQGQAQAVCPVLSGKTNKNVYTDYQGKRIYFCCAGCIDTFKKNPEKYLKEMEKQGVTPEKTAGK